MAFHSSGLVAEEVEKVNPTLGGAGRARKAVSRFRYKEINAMLLNEFLKEHRIRGGAKERQSHAKRKDFEAAIARQQKQIERHCGPSESERPA